MQRLIVPLLYRTPAQIARGEWGAANLTRGVAVRYNGEEPVLREVSMTVETGEQVTIQGRTVISISHRPQAKTGRAIWL